MYVSKIEMKRKIKIKTTNNQTCVDRNITLYKIQRCAKEQRRLKTIFEIRSVRNLSSFIMLLPIRSFIQLPIHFDGN